METIITIKQILILQNYQYILFIYLMLYNTTIDEPAYQGTFERHFQGTADVNRNGRTLHLLNLFTTL